MLPLEVEQKQGQIKIYPSQPIIAKAMKQKKAKETVSQPAKEQHQGFQRGPPP